MELQLGFYINNNNTGKIYELIGIGKDDISEEKVAIYKNESGGFLIRRENVFRLTFSFVSKQKFNLEQNIKDLTYGVDDIEQIISIERMSDGAKIKLRIKGQYCIWDVKGRNDYEIYNEFAKRIESIK